MTVRACALPAAGRGVGDCTGRMLMSARAVTWGGQILQMFTLPLIQGLLTLLDQVLDALGPGLGLQQLIDLIGPGGLADLLGLLGLGGLKTSA